MVKVKYNEESRLLPRIIHKAVESHLRTFEAVYIEGGKWRGKTWNANIYSNSSVYLGDPAEISRTSLWQELIPNWY